MNIEKGKISPLQLMFLIGCFIQGSVLLISFMDTIAKHDSWLVIIAAYVVSIPIIFSFAYLIKMFPGKNIVQINETVYGKYLGGVISFLYFAFFLLLLSLNLRDMANFHRTFVLSETPLLVIVIIITLLSAFALKCGIEAISRSSPFVVIYSIFITIATSLFLFKDMKVSNFLPVFDIPMKTFIQSTAIVAVIPFCDIVVFLMVMPSLNNFKKTWLYTFLGYTLGALALIMVSLRNTAVLGPSSSIFIGGSYQSVRIIDIGSFLTRIDIFVGIGITIVLFIKTCVLYYASVTSISQLFKLRSNLTLILPIGAIAAIMAIIIFDSSVYHSSFGKTHDQVWAILWEVILPITTIAVAKIRKLQK